VSKIVVVVAMAAAAFLASQSTAYAPPALRVQILENSADRIGVRNADGEWWIAKRCLGTPGPGYVYLVKHGGKAVVDDEDEPVLDDPNGGLNPYGSSGGLGSFSYQHARGIPPFEFGRRGGSNTWWVTSRVCSGSHPQDPGLFGVSGRCCRVGPLRWDVDGALHWSIEVDLRTPWQDPILRIGYEYVFSAASVQLRTTVRSFCAQPTCGDAPNQHFAKEPKFTMQVVPTAGDTIAVYNAAGGELTRWLGGHPRRGTGQVGQDARDSVVFTASGLKVVARGASGRWEGSGSGLDEWAVAASGYAPAPSDADGPAPLHYASGKDTRWDCNGGSPSGDRVRQWELVGGAPGYPLAVFFHGWEGGVGHNDCEPAARHFPPPSAVFENYFEYTIASDSGGRTRELTP
jgi:hypothetical protein